MNRFDANKEILALLTDYINNNPDQRFGQILRNLGVIKEVYVEKEIYWENYFNAESQFILNKIKNNLELFSSSFKLGDFVKFKDKVFKAPYSPYFDYYKGHTYFIEALPFEAPGHLKLGHQDPNLSIQFFIHEDEIELVDGYSLK